MKSIRGRITLLTALTAVASLVSATIVGIVLIRNLGKSDSEKMLSLLCETGEKNLDSYFNDVENSVETVSKFAQEDLNKIEPAQLDDHMDRVSSLFENVAINTSGVLTYYYRVEPENTNDGFWYIKTDEGFVSHEVTKLDEYDLNDTSSIVWYTVPRTTKKSIWLPPYITENLGARVFSYNVPIMRNNVFFGVIGIEIDYKTVAEQVNNIKLFDNGYAFINDNEGNIVYHPRIDVTALTDENKPKVPNGLLSEEKYVFYNYEGQDKMAVWLPLSNGMRLNVCVPISEIGGNWEMMLYIMIAVSSILLLITITVGFAVTNRITKPIRALSRAAVEVNNGNYDVKLNYNRNNEIGLLTVTFNNLISHFEDHINELHGIAYGDALTSMNNRGAFDADVHAIQDRIDAKTEKVEFAVAIFDIDNLKVINDTYGHRSGDIYIKTAGNYICSIFKENTAYRIGGDEFAVILQDEAYKNRNKLIDQFIQNMNVENNKASHEWNKVHISVGLAVYNPKEDLHIDEVIAHADIAMYKNKEENRKKKEE